MKKMSNVARIAVPKKNGEGSESCRENGTRVECCIEKLYLYSSRNVAVIMVQRLAGLPTSTYQA